MGKAEEFKEIKSEKVVEILFSLLKDKDENMRWRAAQILGYIKLEKAVDPLISALNDESENVRMYAAEALGSIKSDKAVEPLINTLRDEDVWVRGFAARALEDICTIRNRTQLDNLLESEHEFSVNTAYEILTKIEKQERSKIILFETVNSKNSISPKYGIFVSSVQKELENERVTIHDLVGNDSFLSAHYTSLLYEYEPASPEKTLDGCLNALNSCQVYVLIVGVKYGTLVGNISITHREYRYAKEKGFPILVFIKGERNIKRRAGN